jgi:hypothetical protein
MKMLISGKGLLYLAIGNKKIKYIQNNVISITLLETILISGQHHSFK